MKSLLKELAAAGIKAKFKNDKVKIRRIDMNLLSKAAKKPGFHLEQFKKTLEEKERKRAKSFNEWKDIAIKVVDGLLRRLVDESLDVMEKNLKDNQTDGLFSLNLGLKANNVDSPIDYFKKFLTKSKYASLLHDIEENDIPFEEFLIGKLENNDLQLQKNANSELDLYLQKILFGLMNVLSIGQYKTFQIFQKKIGKIFGI